MGLIERIRAGRYEPDDAPATVAPGRIPTIRESARRVVDGGDPLFVVRELLDVAGRLDGGSIGVVIDERPDSTGNERADALFAAIAEYLATGRGRPVPPWTQEPSRFLERFWFVSEEPGFRAIALAQTPVSLKRRGILWPARSLERV